MWHLIFGQKRQIKKQHLDRRGPDKGLQHSTFLIELLRQINLRINPRGLDQPQTSFIHAVDPVKPLVIAGIQRHHIGHSDPVLRRWQRKNRRIGCQSRLLQPPRHGARALSAGHCQRHLAARNPIAAFIRPDRFTHPRLIIGISVDIAQLDPSGDFGKWRTNKGHRRLPGRVQRKLVVGHNIVGQPRAVFEHQDAIALARVKSIRHHQGLQRGTRRCDVINQIPAHQPVKTRHIKACHP